MTVPTLIYPGVDQIRRTGANSWSYNGCWAGRHNFAVDRGAAAAIHGLELNGPDSRSPGHRDVEFGPSPDPTNPMTTQVTSAKIKKVDKLVMVRF